MPIAKQAARTNWPIIWVILLAFLLRLFGITNPVLDWHAFRQADTASVTREFVKHGINLLVPTYHDHSNIQTGKDNLLGYRLVEFPIINGLVAKLVLTWPRLDLVMTSRLVSVFLSLIAILALYYLIREISGDRLAFWSALTMAVLPYSVYYSRVVLPEPGLLAASLLSLWGLVKYLKAPNWRWWLLTWFGLCLAFLLKPFVVFLAPVYLVLIWQSRGLKSFWSWDLVLLAITSVLPFLAWRNWLAGFPTGIPASDWLFNGNGIRFRPAWFRWLFWERITKLIWGGLGLSFAVANLANLPELKTKTWWRQDWLVYAAWWLGIISYFSVMATGNVQHDYYQVMAIPILSLTLARGILITADALVKRWSTLASNSISAIILLTCALISWTQIKGYYQINHWEYVEAGAIVNQLTRPNAQVIAPAFGDTMFLFQTNRTGWPIGFEIDDKIAKGATNYITTSYDDEARMLEKRFVTQAKTAKYLLLDLTAPLATGSSNLIETN